MVNIIRHNGYGLAKKNLKYWIVFSFILSVICVFYSFAPSADHEDPWLLWARYTARLSFLMFLVSYIAGPLSVVSAQRFPIFLRHNRRNLGLSFAFLHIVHLAALVIYLVKIGERPHNSTLILGGGAYFAMLLMALTSNDNMVRKLGAKAWSRLHRFGAHYIALIFAVTYATGVVSSDGALINVIRLVLVLLLYVVIVLRIYVFTLERRAHV